MKITPCRENYSNDLWYIMSKLSFPFANFFLHIHFEMRLTKLKISCDIIYRYPNVTLLFTNVFSIYKGISNPLFPTPPRLEWHSKVRLKKNDLPSVSSNKS